MQLQPLIQRLTINSKRQSCNFLNNKSMFKKIIFFWYQIFFIPTNTMTWLRSRKYFSDYLQDSSQVYIIDPIWESRTGLLSNIAFQQAEILGIKATSFPAAYSPNYKNKADKTNSIKNSQERSSQFYQPNSLFLKKKVIRGYLRID